MKIVAISDTHELHQNVLLPEGDILIHCGDFTNTGSNRAIKNFLSWFSSQPHKYKCFIAGNHELGLERGTSKKSKQDLIESFINLCDNFYYLENNSITIENINIYGSPHTPFFNNWEFNLQRGEEIAQKWSQIPDETNVLITHGPPYMILDETPGNILYPGKHVGCQDLLNRIDHFKYLKAHIFGHIHHSYGTFHVNGTTFVNASTCTERYAPINPPIVLEI